MTEVRAAIVREAVSMADAAKLLDVHYETVRRLVSRGELEAFKVGRVLRIRKAVLVRYVQRVAPAKST